MHPSPDHGTMDPNRWRVLEPLLDQALDLSEEGREEWLRQLRAESPDVAQELTAILSGESAADESGFLLGKVRQGEARWGKGRQPQ